MADGPERHHRRSTRLRGYDYSRTGAYFITMCVQDRACLFGEVVAGDMQLNAAGRIVRQEWFTTALVRAAARLRQDEFVIMPNHVHGIIRMGTDGDIPDTAATCSVADDPDTTTGEPSRPGGNDACTTDAIKAGRGDEVCMADPGTPGVMVGATRWVALTMQRPHGPKPATIGAIVAQFKSITTTRINRERQTPGRSVWQRNYYEHILRDEAALERIRDYILNNPARWALDEENPQRQRQAS